MGYRNPESIEELEVGQRVMCGGKEVQIHAVAPMFPSPERGILSHCYSEHEKGLEVIDDEGEIMWIPFNWVEIIDEELEFAEFDSADVLDRLGRIEALIAEIKGGLS